MFMSKGIESIENMSDMSSIIINFVLLFFTNSCVGLPLINIFDYVFFKIQIYSHCQVEVKYLFS